MAFPSYSVAAPGSLMLFGEHAVLHGKKALVAAVDLYIKVKLTPNNRDKITIKSKNFGTYSTSIKKFKTAKKYNFVLHAIKEKLKKIKSGFDLEISSEFSSSIGFGSSGALVVATLGALNLWLEKKIDPMKIHTQGLKVIKSVQGLGSGADIAASIFGGVVAYKAKPKSIKKIANSLPLIAIYSGSKLKTKEVVTKVKNNYKKFPEIYSLLYNSMDLCSKKAITAIKNKNWKKVGRLMNIHQGLQDAIGVNNAILAELIYSIRQKPNIYGAKISGSGLGDSIIALGKSKKNSFPENKIQKKIGVKQINFNVGKKGLHVIR